MTDGEHKRVRLRTAMYALLAAAAVVVGTAAPALASNDPLSAKQWDMTQIGAPAAWARTTGAGAKIGIVDTGVAADHEDLAGRVVAFANCLGRPCADAAPFDDNGHGTHLAGIAGASKDNGKGIAGVASSAQFVVAKVMANDPSSGGATGSIDDINAGIHWVVDHGAQVVNLSLGSDPSDPVAIVSNELFGNSSLSDGVEYAWAHGAVAVLAAGNTNYFGLGRANYGDAHALVVGATGPEGRVAAYSSGLGDAQWGLVAPGGDDTDKADCSDAAQQARCVVSTWPGNKYAWAQGTSMAAPHVAGAVALLRSQGLNAAQAVQRILDTAAKVPCGQGCHGLLDTAAAVGLAPTPPQAVAQGGGSPGPAGLNATHAPSGPRSTTRPPAATTSASPATGDSTTSTNPAPTVEAPAGDNPVLAAGAPKSTIHSGRGSSSRAGQVALAIGLLGVAGVGTGLAVRRLRGVAAP